MKTIRLAPSFAEILTCVLACLAATTILSATVSAQTTGLDPTPDPYFSRQVTPERNGITKFPPTDSHDHEPIPSLWTAPRTIADPDAPQPTVEPTKKPVEQTTPSTPAVAWNAPLTNVKTTQAEEVLRQDNALEPIQFSPSNSIIREQKSLVEPNANSSASNSFGGPVMESPRKPLAGTADNASRGLADQNDFQFGDNPAWLKKSTPTTQLFNNVGPDRITNSVSSESASPADSNIATREPLQPFEPGKVLALVGGKPIFVGDVLFEINQMIEKFMPEAPPNIKERERQKMIPQILPKFVESKMLYLGTLQMLPDGADLEEILDQAGKEFDEKALEKMITGSGLKSATEFDAQLRAMGSSLRKLRRSWSQDQLTKFFLGQQLSIDSEVTHQEMLDSYRADIDSYAVPAKCRWEQVMVRFDRSASRAVAKQTLVELGNQIVYGANLAAVAKKSSHGFLASEGGQHDWTTKGALVLKEIDEAIFSLPVGELSDMIESRDGYHVLRVIERTDATRTPFLEAQVEIKQRIVGEKRKSAFDKHIAKLKREIPVEYYLNDTDSNASQSATPRTAKR